MLSAGRAPSTVDEPRRSPVPPSPLVGRLEKKAVMTSIEMDAREYLKWMAIHNYARTTITAGAATSGTSSSSPARRESIGQKM